MARSTKSKWDERFRTQSYPENPEPSPLLREYVTAIPAGRALDVATGTGRNALFLADVGYTVDAIDQSRVGLKIAREEAARRGTDARTNWIQADMGTVCLPVRRYQVITISFFRCLDRFTDLKAALAPEGYLFVEHHLRSTDPTLGGPSDEQYRFGANELLRACLDLTVLYYDETIEDPPDGDPRATVRVLARKSTGAAQSYPPRERHEREGRNRA